MVVVVVVVVVVVMVYRLSFIGSDLLAVYL